MRVNCGGLSPWNGCPKGWSQYVWLTDLTVCYKVETEVGEPVHGTLCGLHSYQYKSYPFDLNIACSTTTNVLSGTCPLGYQRYTADNINKDYGHRNSVCVLIDAKEHLSGTICGMQIEDTVNGPSCNGFHPSLCRCPSEYFPQRTAFNAFGFMVCVKK
jgi:hypothetical protein